MSLLNIAKEIKESGFDARKDSANGSFESIPAGEYPVMLYNASFNVSDSGWEMLRYVFRVIGGEFDEKEERANFGTVDQWNGKDLSWALERTVKFFQKAVILAEDELLNSDFEDGQSLCDALNRKAVGSMYTLIITENTGKNGKIYRNYDLMEAPEELVAPGGSPMEIKDEDLPF